jgi:hypothetical protein
VDNAFKEHFVAPDAPPDPAPIPSSDLSPIQASISPDLQKESSLRAVNRENRFDLVSCLLTTMMLADLGLLGAFLLFAFPFSLSSVPPIPAEQIRNVLGLVIILIVGTWAVARTRAVPARSGRRARKSTFNRGG